MDAKASSELSDGIDAPRWMFWKRRRYIVVLMAFLGCLVMYAMRVAMSIAVVAMTEKRAISFQNGTVGYEQAFDWSSKVRGNILSSFFWGYLVTQLPAGVLGNRLGATNILGIGLGFTTVLTLLTPLSAYGGVSWLIGNRILQGMAQGVALPCLHGIWSKWAPPSERSRMVLISLVGMFAGTILAMLVTGAVSKRWNWESAFYIFGVIGCIWFVAFFLMIHPTPEQDRTISKAEKEFIIKSLGNVEGQSGGIKHPWKGILTSKPVFAILVSGFCQSWGFYNMLTQLPSFLKDALHFDVEHSGSIAALPYLGMGLMLNVSGYLADWFQIKGILTTTQVRRYFNCGSFLVQATLTIIGAAILRSIPTITCLTLAVSMGAFAWSGYLVNHLDLSSKSAGVLMGIGNSASTIAGIIAPVVTGLLTSNKSPDEWRAVFYITAGLQLVGLVVYWFWASGELQPWSVEVQEKERVKVAGTDGGRQFERNLSVVDLEGGLKSKY
ncbi:sialin [Culex quinquefasciatus]|uniref:Sialin n=1 Tax=Culex quinquefasciatus TaxID=7176 RepID=B0WK20_CULQU|nr:sialin [Culex quinquefasciatus]|eukprot:XP_001849054.1 sialin [Culex quinquefasciatus]